MVIFTLLLEVAHAQPQPVVRHVPSVQYPTVKAAYAAAQSGDIIEIDPNLYLELPRVLFEDVKAVTFRPSAGRVFVTATNGPPNDTYASRQTLTGSPVTISTDNYSAAAAPESSDPLPRAVNGNSLAFGRSVWFDWTAPSTGLAIVNTVGSDFSALLEVFKGDPPSYLSESELVWFGFNEFGFNAQAGAHYPILVGGQSRNYGEIALNISMIGPPANDPFAAAYELLGESVQVQGATFAATFEDPLEQNPGGLGARHSAWFRWTAPAAEGRFSRPVNLSTAGSDFDTVLAVYEGDSLTGLSLRTNRDDRTLAELESEISFTPDPGRTYYIALDGAAKAPKPRDKIGNYLLRLDYSLPNVAVVRPVEVGPPVEQRIGFQAELAIRAWGPAPTGPLRVRLAARSGRDRAGIHRAPASSETTLQPVFPRGGSGLPPDGAWSVTVAGTVPAPVIRDSITNIWGVFAVLEEEFAGEWIPIDRTFLLYGYIPEGNNTILSYGVGRPTPASLVANEVNQILAYDVRVSNFVTEASTNRFSVIAKLDLKTNPDRVVSNAVWSGSSWVSVATNGILRVGDIPFTTNFSVLARFPRGNRWVTNSDTVPIYKRPRLTLNSSPQPGLFNYIVQSDFPGRYTLEYKDNDFLGGWKTNSVVALNRFPSTNSFPGTNLFRRFYRLNVWP